MFVKKTMRPITILAVLMFLLMPTVYFHRHITLENLLSLLSNYAFLAASWSAYRTFDRQSQSFEVMLAPEQKSEFKNMQIRVGLLGVLAVGGIGIAFGSGIGF